MEGGPEERRALAHLTQVIGLRGLGEHHSGRSTSLCGWQHDAGSTCLDGVG